MSPRTRVLTVAYATANFSLLVLPTLALAADAKKGPPAPQPSYGEDKPLDLPLDEAPRQLNDAGASGGGSLVRTFVGLAVVVAVIYGLYWVLRQVKSSREERSVGTGLASQAVVPLGPNRSLHLVRAGRELVLLGVAEHGVTPIRSYTEEEAAQVGLITPAGENGDELEPLPDPTAKRHPSGAMTIGQLIDKVRLWTVRK